MIQDVTNDGVSVFFTMVFIFTKNQNDFSVCPALITINDNSCYFIINFFRRSGGSKLLLYSIAGMLFVCCAEWHNDTCVLCRLI